ncbi:hypothetical protein B0H14DRAFT_3903314 [Mycena olivaceomarginata]|nr:hypothetical protein B0H14DRAFT_3903314 [Mycena olivaceomarginata]
MPGRQSCHAARSSLPSPHLAFPPRSLRSTRLCVPLDSYILPEALAAAPLVWITGRVSFKKTTPASSRSCLRRTAVRSASKLAVCLLCARPSLRRLASFARTPPARQPLALSCMTHPRSPCTHGARSFAPRARRPSRRLVAFAAFLPGTRRPYTPHARCPSRYHVSFAWTTAASPPRLNAASSCLRTPPAYSPHPHAGRRLVSFASTLPARTPLGLGRCTASPLHLTCARGAPISCARHTPVSPHACLASALTPPRTLSPLRRAFFIQDRAACVLPVRTQALFSFVAAPFPSPARCSPRLAAQRLRPHAQPRRTLRSGGERGHGVGHVGVPIAPPFRRRPASSSSRLCAHDPLLVVRAAHRPRGSWSPRALRPPLAVFPPPSRSPNPTHCLPLVAPLVRTPHVRPHAHSPCLRTHARHSLRPRARPHAVPPFLLRTRRAQRLPRRPVLSARRTPRLFWLARTPHVLSPRALSPPRLARPSATRLARPHAARLARPHVARLVRPHALLAARPPAARASLSSMFSLAMLLAPVPHLSPTFGSCLLVSCHLRRLPALTRSSNIQRRFRFSHCFVKLLDPRFQSPAVYHDAPHFVLPRCLDPPCLLALINSFPQVGISRERQQFPPRFHRHPDIAVWSHLRDHCCSADHRSKVIRTKGIVQDTKSRFPSAKFRFLAPGLEKLKTVGRSR